MEVLRQSQGGFSEPGHTRLPLVSPPQKVQSVFTGQTGSNTQWLQYITLIGVFLHVPALIFRDIQGHSHMYPC